MKVRSSAAPKVSKPRSAPLPRRAQSGTLIRSPEKFRGVFADVSQRYAPLIIAAREELAAVPLPPEIADRYRFGVLEHDQPSFMLLPLMFLMLAEETGGVTPRHRAYLPWFMLGMELIAVIDDAIDCAQRRSERDTFVERYGMMTLVPFSHLLFATAVEGLAHRVPEGVPVFVRSFSWLCTLETTELATRYPSAHAPSTLERLLQFHYDQARCEIHHALDAALVLHGRKPFPRDVAALMGELMQDVDDLVNLVEQRESAGENDDLRLGTVTHPLLATLHAVPTFASALDALWAQYRRLDASERGEFMMELERCARTTAPQYDAVRAAMIHHGVPQTLAKIERDVQTCSARAPSEFRAYVDSLNIAFADRGRRLSSPRTAIAG